MDVRFVPEKLVKINGFILKSFVIVILVQFSNKLEKEIGSAIEFNVFTSMVTFANIVELPVIVVMVLGITMVLSSLQLSSLSKLSGKLKSSVIIAFTKFGNEDAIVTLVDLSVFTSIVNVNC
jgi:hypothetical protein